MTSPALRRPFSEATPPHWRRLKLKHVASIRLSNVDKKSVEGEQSVRLCNYVDVYNNDFITADIPFMEATATEGQIERFRLKAGDVLITKDSEAWDDIAVPALVPVDLDGVLCGYHLAHVRPRSEVMVGRFLARAFSADGIADQFRVAANGITRFGIGMDEISAALFPVPPLNEQHAIADYLDRKTAEIDALIAKKRKMIDLLHEKRQALISEAVTRGLNPDVPMKDSGIEWLGQIPGHWDVSPIKRRWSIIDCKHRTVTFHDEGFPVASIGEVQSIDLDLENAKKTTWDEYLDLIAGGRRPKRGDIVYSRNATVGAAAFVGTDIEFCMGQDVCLITSIGKNQRFLVHQLRSPIVMRQLDSLMVGATFRRINVAQIRNLLVCCPPLEEQSDIAVHCDAISDRINRAVSLLEEQTAKLRVYRQALISDAVTGKIDVEAMKA